jgi:hypothetical protein
MLGSLFGFGLSVVFVSTAWSDVTSKQSFFYSGSEGTVGIIDFLIIAELSILFYGLAGIFLFPRTVFSSLFIMSMITPIAFLVALFRHGFLFSLTILVIGISSWIFAFFIRVIRADADPRR